MGQAVVKIFKALADSTRVEIVMHLAQHGERSCQELSQRFPLSQPTLSHHFHKLLDAQILEVRKDGVQHFYRINAPYLRSLGINLTQLAKA